MASAIGRGFGLPLLEKLLSHEQVVPALSDLMRLDLIVEVSRRPSPEYRFRHGLVQEVAYNSLLEPARRNLHRRIGEAIEALYGDAGESVYGPLARHFSEADEPERAARYSLLAGDAARSVYADHEALDHYRRARAFLRRLDDPARERETLFKIALVRHLAFDYSRAGQAYDAAFDCSAVERTERAPSPAQLEIALVRPDSYAPGDTYSSDSAIVIEQLFRGLLRIDHDLNVVPELAQNMNVSADGLTYMFMLREDACWSDGHPLTAEDFVYAWRKLREEGHVTAFLLDDIESAEALDDWTLEVHLREPRNYFPYVLASHWAYPWPRHRADEVGAAWRRPESLVGNGPYVLAEVDEMGARLTANPHWSAGAGNVGEVRIVFTKRSEEAPLGDWLAGRYDLQLVRDAPVAAADTIADRSPTLSTNFLGFNAGHELMADERVRRALAHAIDSAALVAASPGVDLAAGRGGGVPPVMPGHADGAGLAYDVERARELLAEAGFPGGDGFPELRIDARPWSPTDVLAEQLARDRRPRALRDQDEVVRRLGGDARVVHRLARRLPRSGRLLPRAARAQHAALPRRRDERDPRQGARLARPRRAPQALPPVRAHLDRGARRDRADLVLPPARPAAAERARPEAQSDGRVPPRAGRRRPAPSTLIVSCGP